jgi:serine/threonine protein kinase
MAPERLLGASGDARADIYSLAATLHELLTGRLPRPELQDLRLLAQAQARDLPASVHEGLRHTVKRALSRDAQERPALQDIAAALSQAASAPGADVPAAAARERALDETFSLPMIQKLKK